MRNIWKKWTVVAEKVGNFQIAVIFSLLYFVILTPVGILVRIYGDFFNIKEEPRWHKFEDTTSNLTKLKKQ